MRTEQGQQQAEDRERLKTATRVTLTSRTPRAAGRCPWGRSLPGSLSPGKPSLEPHRRGDGCAELPRREPPGPAAVLQAPDPGDSIDSRGDLAWDEFFPPHHKKLTSPQGWEGFGVVELLPTALFPLRGGPGGCSRSLSFITHSGTKTPSPGYRHHGSGREGEARPCSAIPCHGGMGTGPSPSLCRGVTPPTQEHPKAVGDPGGHTLPPGRRSYGEGTGKGDRILLGGEGHRLGRNHQPAAGALGELKKPPAVRSHTTASGYRAKGRNGHFPSTGRQRSSPRSRGSSPRSRGSPGGCSHRPKSQVCTLNPQRLHRRSGQMPAASDTLLHLAMPSKNSSLKLFL